MPDRLCTPSTGWMRRLFFVFSLVLLVPATQLTAQTGEVDVTGELKRWHPIELTLDGPFTTETSDPNPFLDYRFDVTFTNGAIAYEVPGFFAADGDAANTSATSGTKWRARFTPDETGTWTYTIAFREGDGVAVSDSPTAGTPNEFDGITGTFTIGETDKTGIDFRAKGVLRHVGEHFLQFDNGEWFVTNGTGSPENFFGYTEFDNTTPAGFDYRKDYDPHIADWNTGDPTWQGDKGKGIIGAINYLSSQGVNSQYIMVMNTQGDGEETHPWIAREDFYHFDVSKLAQWNIVMEYMNQKGMRPHLVLQEMGNDYLLDNGELGTERTMYYRELIARFGHLNGIKWNIGEEHRTPENGGNTDAQRMDFVNYLTETEPYGHPVVMHTSAGGNNYDALYGPFLGHPEFGGMSYHIHGPTNDGADTGGGLSTYENAREWRENSANAGRKWIITLDECCGWNTGVKPDQSNIVAVRKDEMWGTLMAGATGFDWYLGFESELRDLLLEDFRRYDFLWETSRNATDFFREYLPFVDMDPVDNLTPISTNRVLAKPGEIYVMYLRDGGTTTLDLESSTETFMVDWYNPRSGGELISGAVTEITGPGVHSLGTPPFDTTQDWVVLVRSEDAISPVVARFTWSESEIPFTIDFDASTSSSTDAAIVAYDWAFGDGSTGSGEFTSHAYAAPGFYTVTLTVTDALGGSDEQTQTIEVEDPNATGAFLEQDGLLVIEAEHFEENVTRNGQTWTESTTFTGFEGSGTMAALPDNGQIYTTGYGATSPYINLLADFTNTGTFYVWVRVRAVSSGNTLHVGLNNAETPSAEALESNNFSGYEWVRTRKGDGGNATLEIPSPGEHDITIWMREDGIHFDRIVMTTDASFVPTGGGPAESPRAGSAPLASFIATPASGQAPLFVDFDASASTPPIGATIVSYTWDFGDGATGSGEITSHTYTTEGTYTVTLTVEASNGATDTATETITVDPDTPPGDGAFIEAGGLLVIEAEHYEASITRNGQTWTESTEFAGFEGDGAMAALPDNGQNYNSGYGVTSPYMNFLADFTNTGTYYVWARVRAVPSGNTLHVGLNETETPSAQGMFSFNFESWSWIQTNQGRTAATLSIGSAGEQRITVWMREDGIHIDRFVLTTDAGFVPTGGGPPESERAGDPPAGDPVAAFTAAPSSGDAPLAVSFDASASTPGDGATLTGYAWDFGDGNAGTGETTDHTYETAGTFTATLTVTDSNGNTDAATEEITVTDPPSGDALHVSAITTVIIRGANRTAFGEATVTIVDQNNTPVPDATVTGTFSGDVDGTATAVTDASGIVIVQSNTVTVRPFVATFCVDDVTHASLEYDPNANADPGFACLAGASSGAYLSGAGDLQEDVEPVPTEFNLGNYPNPFNPVTTIRIDLPEASHAVVKVYDMLGKHVATLVDGFKEAGTYRVAFDASMLGTGLYVYTLEAGDFSATRTMVLVK